MLEQNYAEVPGFMGLTPDAPTPYGALELWNAHVVDGGKSLQAKQLGRYCEEFNNPVRLTSITKFSLMMTEARFSNKKKIIIDSNPFVYMAENITTQQGDISIGPWEEILDFSGSPLQVVNPHYAMMMDRLIRVDGVGSNLSIDYNGDSTVIGLNPPSTAPTVTATTGGSMEAGVYDLYYCYVKYAGTANEVRSLPTSATRITLAAPNNAMSVVIKATTQPDVDKIRIYRTLKDAGGMAFLAKENANADATVTLTQADVYIRGAEEMSFDWVKPPTADYAISAGNRLFLFSQEYGRAFVSESGKIEQFSAYGYTSDFDRDDGDMITGVYPTKNNILVFKRTKIFSVDLFSGFPVNIIDAQDGCINYRTLASDEVTGAIFFLSPSGVKAILPDGSKRDLTVNKVWKKDMLANIVALQDSTTCFGSYSQASGCYHLYFQKDGDPENSVHYVCSIRESGAPDGAWSKYDHRYSLDPDDSGLKFYAFSILTDNAGLPYLCAPANNLSSAYPTRIFQLEGSDLSWWHKYYLGNVPGLYGSIEVPGEPDNCVSRVMDIDGNVIVFGPWKVEGTPDKWYLAVSLYTGSACQHLATIGDGVSTAADLGSIGRFGVEGQFIWIEADDEVYRVGLDGVIVSGLDYPSGDDYIPGEEIVYRFGSAQYTRPDLVLSRFTYEGDGDGPIAYFYQYGPEYPPEIFTWTGEPGTTMNVATTYGLDFFAGEEFDDVRLQESTLVTVPFYFLKSAAKVFSFQEDNEMGGPYPYLSLTAIRGIYRDGGVDQDGYASVNVRIRMCELKHDGGYLQKRYLRHYFSVESDLPISADIKLQTSAKDQIYSRAVPKYQQRSFVVPRDYVPVESGENIVQGKVNFSLTGNDIFTTITIGPLFGVGYKPFKISGLGYLYQRMAITK